MTCQQMPRDSARHTQTTPVSVLGCLAVSVFVCWHVVLPGDAMGCLGDVWGVSEGYLSGIHRNWRRSDVFGGYVGSQSLQYGTKTLFRCSPERQNFCHLTILRHWNIKMVAYKLSKNGWVMPFFVIFRLAREKLLVTVALDHPVVLWFVIIIHYLFDNGLFLLTASAVQSIWNFSSDTRSLLYDVPLSIRRQTNTRSDFHSV